MGVRCKIVKVFVCQLPWKRGEQLYKEKRAPICLLPEVGERPIDSKPITYGSRRRGHDIQGRILVSLLVIF